jgi:uncharacterized low-complexity protein
MSKLSNKPLSIVLGAAMVTSLGVAGLANAKSGEDIFAMEELSSGYLTAGAHEGSCGEDKGKGSEGSCGEKGGEGSCGENKDGEKKGGEGSCGEKKDGEGKCGEGKCGGAS